MRQAIILSFILTLYDAFSRNKQLHMFSLRAQQPHEDDMAIQYTIYNNNIGLRV